MQKQERKKEEVMDGEEWCPAVARRPADRNYWYCTLPRGHDGNHKAGNGSGRFYHKWSDAPPEPPPDLLREAVEALKEARYVVYLKKEDYRSDGHELRAISCRDMLRKIDSILSRYTERQRKEEEQ
jgi:hypothetical protein